MAKIGTNIQGRWVKNFDPLTQAINQPKAGQVTNVRVERALRPDGALLIKTSYEHDDRSRNHNSGWKIERRKTTREWLIRQLHNLGGWQLMEGPSRRRR